MRRELDRHGVRVQDDAVFQQGVWRASDFSSERICDGDRSFDHSQSDDVGFAILRFWGIRSENQESKFVC